MTSDSLDMRIKKFIQKSSGIMPLRIKDLLPSELVRSKKEKYFSITNLIIETEYGLLAFSEAVYEIESGSIRTNHSTVIYKVNISDRLTIESVELFEHPEFYRQNPIGYLKQDTPISDKIYRAKPNSFSKIVKKYMENKKSL